jgi:NAD(P)-dependent dehydrogenase (short-subunit alcohol dehydrogenase family)
MFKLTGKIAIITGGGSGIGKSMSKLFADQGALVYIFDLDENGARETITEISVRGGKAVFVHCNIASEKAVADGVGVVASEKGRIDILVNNAGIAHIGNAENTSMSDIDRLLAVNVKGVCNIIRNVIPFMKQLGGVILNLASVAALVGLPDRFAYSMTKGAVNGITLSVARDYLPYKIRCNAVSPARVHTPFVDGFLKKNYPGKEQEMFEKLSATQPVGRMATPDEVAYLALYLCSDEAAFITGCDYPIDGGFTRLNN